MKKKFLISILVFICAAFCALAVSACNSIYVSQNGGTAGSNTGIGNTDDGDGDETDDGNTDDGDGDSTDDENTDDGDGESPDDGNTDDGNGDNTDDGNTEHNHVYYTTYVDPTCTEDGYIIYKCECGDEYQEIYRKATGHYLVEREGVPATCTESGFEDYEECFNCDYTTFKEIPALGHDITVHSAKEPTCTEKGWTDYEECSRCDYSTYSELPLLEHQFEWTANRSYCANACTECGFVKDTHSHNFVDGECSFCGYAYNSYLDIFNGTYGYEYLATMHNGESLQKLYSDIDYEVRAFHDNGESVSGDYCFAEVNFADYGLSMDEAVNVWITYRSDNPLYYWFPGELAYTEENLYLCAGEDYADGAVRTELNKKLYMEAEEWIKVVRNESSVYMKTLAFHDLIIETVDYAYEGNKPQSAHWAHNVLGVFEKRGAVCEGYAKTFQLLLNLCGVENIFVSGDGNGELHAWNLVKLDDGEWYWYDLTWDDTPARMWGISYNYFASTDENFLKRHTAGSESGTGTDFLYGLPARSQTAYAGKEVNTNDKFTYRSFEFLKIGYNNLSLTKITGKGDVEIPSTVIYGGIEYSVVAIGDKRDYDQLVFSLTQNVNVTKVFIPATVRFISEGNFCGWYGLKEINVDENNPSYRSLDGVLFTKSLDVIITYPYAHEGSSYVIPEQTVMIAAHAFSVCQQGRFEGRNLESLTLHAGIKSVGNVDFGGGYGGIIQNVIMGAWKDLIGGLAGKQELIIDEDNPWFKVRNGLIFSSDLTYVFGVMPHTENIVIPETVTGFDQHVFNIDCIKTVVLPEGWTTVRSYMFSSCDNLESIYIPDSVTSIEDHAFFWDEHLNEITIPVSVKYLGDKCFGLCGNLTVRFKGTREQWDEIIKEDGFSYRTDLTLIFESN